MSKTEDAATPPGKSKGLVKWLVISLLLAGAGGGAAFGLMAAGLLGGDARHGAPQGPQLVLKGEEDPYAAAAEGGKEGPPMVHGDGGSKYRTAYYTFAEDFTSNLRDSDSLVQLSLAASTRRDGRVLQWLDEHALAIRSQILVVIADTSAEDIQTPQGKTRLQARLTKAVNGVLIAEEGFGGVDQVYFRNFIVQ